VVELRSQFAGGHRPSQGLCGVVEEVRQRGRKRCGTMKPNRRRKREADELHQAARRALRF
jgi:hypothetical protein